MHMILHGLASQPLHLPQAIARSICGVSPYLSRAYCIARDLALVAAKNIPTPIHLLQCEEEAAGFTQSRGKALKQLKKKQKGQKSAKGSSKRMLQAHAALASGGAIFGLENDCMSRGNGSAQQMEHFTMSLGLQSSML